MLHAMPDDAVAAIGACRCQRLDRALEAVEDHGAATHCDRKALVVVIAALLACRHGFSPPQVKLTRIRVPTPPAKRRPYRKPHY